MGRVACTKGILVKEVLNAACKGLDGSLMDWIGSHCYDLAGFSGGRIRAALSVAESSGNKAAQGVIMSEKDRAAVVLQTSGENLDRRSSRGLKLELELEERLAPNSLALTNAKLQLGANRSSSYGNTKTGYLHFLSLALLDMPAFVKHPAFSFEHAARLSSGNNDFMISEAQKALWAIAHQQGAMKKALLDNAVQECLTQQMSKLKEITSKHSITVEYMKGLIGGQTHYHNPQKVQWHNMLLHTKDLEVNTANNVAAARDILVTTDKIAKELSEMGRQYHHFPKGTFRARFSPPALPKFMLSHLTNHPPVWTWSIKAGPNKGKTFQVPTVPITCDRTTPKAVQWIVAVFHSFKAHLNPIAINTDTGRVLLAWLRLYQNNLYLHFHTQLKAHSSRRKNAPLPKPAPGTPNPAPTGPKADRTCPQEGSLEAKVVALRTEIQSLKGKLYNYISTHEACCCRNDPPTSSSSSEADAEAGDPPSEPSQPPFELLTQRPDGIMIPDSNPPTWLTTVLSRIDLPPAFTGALFVPGQLANHLPRDATDVIKLHYHGSPPFCLAVHADRSLWIAGSASVDHSQITTIIKLPPDPTVPTARS
ncbi:hypothetical protein EDD15DRAFT_2191018 [Pisolithus albus]|nr:hypothetical protein EDD15DRAFT_2191018 [Pisolithus albus]